MGKLFINALSKKRFLYLTTNCSNVPSIPVLLVGVDQMVVA